MAPPFINSVSSHAIAAFVGASSALTIANYFRCSDESRSTISISTDGDNSERDQIDRSRKPSHPALHELSAHKSSPLPFIRSPITILQPNPDLEIAYDARTKNPIYVLERLQLQSSTKTSTGTSKPNKKTANRVNHTFHEPKSIPPHHRPRNGYYRKSGFDRGHMAAAANYSNHDDAKMNDTFSLANVSPQHPVMNRVVWSALEVMTRSLLTDHDEGQEKNREGRGSRSRRRQAFVITGPLWLPGNAIRVQDENSQRRNLKRDFYQYSYPGIGVPPQLVHVPSHFFKVIFSVSESGEGGDVENGGGEVEDFAAFVVPNHSFDGVDRVNLQDYLVRLTDLEAVAGITFFPEKEQQDSLEMFDLITEQVWMKDNVAMNDLGDRGGTNTIVAPAPSSSLPLSKKRRAKIRKRLSEMEKNGSLPTHLCLKGSCDKVVRIRKT